MSEHRVELEWRRNDAPFTYEEYSRDHQLVYDGGSIEASAAAEYRGSAAKDAPPRIDPEQLMIGALSSCHMLTFLAVAAKKRFQVESYDDKAVGLLDKNEDDKLALTLVKLHPTVRFGGERLPDEADIARIHEIAHRECFIANSVKTKVEVVSV